MSSTTSVTRIFDGPSNAAPAPRIRQWRVLAISEWQALLRNKVALFNAFILPLLMGVVLRSFGPQGIPMGVFFPLLVTGMAILFIVYYTLVTAVVARRESLLLKRLRAGEVGDGTILLGLATPFIAVTVIQFIIATVAATVFFDLVLTPLVLVAAIGVFVASLTFAALGVASTAFTKSVEHAQITTLPVLLIPLVLSGMFVPLTLMPEQVWFIAELMPLTPVVELISLGVGGHTVDGHAVSGLAALAEAIRPVGVLVAWTVLSLWAITKAMVWEPRS